MPAEVRPDLIYVQVRRAGNLLAEKVYQNPPRPVAAVEKALAKASYAGELVSAEGISLLDNDMLEGGQVYTLHVQPQADPSPDRPPNEPVTYLAITRAHAEKGCIYESEDLWGMEACAPFWQQFEELWPDFLEELQKDPRLEVTFQESEAENYEPFKTILEHLWFHIFISPHDGAAPAVLKGAGVLINRAGADKTLPDIALCRVPDGEPLRSDRLYDCLLLCAEGKTKDAELNHALGQIIAWSRSACQAQGLEATLMPAFAYAGHLVWPAVVSVSDGHSKSPLTKLYRTRDPLTIASAYDVRTTVDFSSRAGKHLTFLVLMAGRQLLEARGEAVQKGDYLLPGDDLRIMVGDQAAEMLLHVGRIFPGRHLTGAVLDASMDGFLCGTSRVAVRVGPAPADVALARALRYDLGPWQQLTREHAALLALPSGCPYLPNLLCEGRLTSVLRGLRGVSASACPDIIGTRVLVTELYGKPLVDPGSGDLPRLGPADLCRLGACLVAAWGVLQAHQVYHNDIRPANIGVRPDGSFYLFDLGAAASPTLDSLFDELAPYGPRLSLADRSPVCSLRWSSYEAILDAPLGALADMQMCMHTLVVLAGGRLPWEDGAMGTFGREDAITARRSMQSNPAAARDVLCCLPAPLQQLGEWVFANCNRRNAPQLQAASWHARLLRAAAAYDSYAKLDVRAAGYAQSLQYVLPGRGVLAF